MPKAPSKHITQYFEMFGHRSIYHDGWRAVCPWPGTSFVESGLGFGAPIDAKKLTELDAKGWELYTSRRTSRRTNNLAEKERAKLIEMIGTWYVEAGKYNVLPIDSRGTARLAEERPQIAVARKSYTFYPGTQMVPANAGPVVLNRPHSITADVEIPKGGAEGCLLSAGDVQGGFALYVQDGKLHYVYNYVGSQFFHAESKDKVPEGRHKLRFEFEVDRQARHRQGQGRAGEGAALHRRQAGRGRRCPGDDAALDRAWREASSAAPIPARRCGTSTSRRSSSPARSTASPWTSAAS